MANTKSTYTLFKKKFCKISIHKSKGEGFTLKPKVIPTFSGYANLSFDSIDRKYTDLGTDVYNCKNYLVVTGLDFFFLDLLLRLELFPELLTKQKVLFLK